MLSAKRVVGRRFARAKWAGFSLLLGFGGVWVLGACVGEIGPAGSSGSSGSSDSACPTAIADLPVEQPTDCSMPTEDQCMLYRIPLMGNPSMDAVLRAKYVAVFGSACYMSEANTFDCFYKSWEAACADAVKVPDVYGAAAYTTGFQCQPVGNGDYTLQVGSDVANKILINYQAAPLQTSLIEIKGIPTEVNGPYRNLVEVTTIKPDKGFDCTSGQVGADGKTLSQKKWILEVNRKAHGGEIHSDLAGFTWPCTDENCKPTTCTEKLVLKDPADKNTPTNDPNRAQVHHVVPRTDQRGCPWGTNAYKNAAVISARLNQHLFNKVPPINEVVQINKVPPCTP